MTQTLDEIRSRLSSGILTMLKAANAGHIASCLSSVEILVSIFFEQIKNKDDLFILSKGHAACALYNVLAESGRLNPELLKTFYKDGTRLAAHPPCQGIENTIPSIPFGTGSLGHGLSLGLGMALAKRLKNENHAQIYCLLSDGECNEGSVWEAAAFAAHHKMKNLWVVVDANGLQGFGRTSEVLDMDLVNQWKAFGFAVEVVDDGNNLSMLHDGFERLKSQNNDKPKCLIAKTTKGNGVSYMEDKLEWHYLPMKAAEFELAIEEIRSRLEKRET